MKRTLVMLIVLASFAIASPVVALEPTATPDVVPSGADEARLWGYIDGDKFKVRIGDETFELNTIGADAPEIDKGELGECYAKEAGERVKKLIAKKATIWLEKDAKDKDGKDRLLRYVWATDTKGKVFMLNERLIKEGYASFKSKDDNTRYDDRFKRAEDAAKKGKKGLWGTCAGPHVELTPPPARGTADNPADVGEAVVSDGREVTLVNAYFVDAYDFLSPDPGNVFLTIEVIIKNVDEKGKSIDYNELCFSATDPDNGYKFDDTLLNPSGQPLGSGDLGSGDVARGEVVLEVRADSQKIRVKYDTGCGIGGKSLYWLVTR